MSRFTDTRWSIVQRAETDRAALDVLCATYRPVIVAWFVRKGLAQDAADDLTQAFFANVLEKKTLSKADPARGRFRTFLLTSLKNFHLNELERAGAQKRGGGAAHLSYEDTVSGQDSPEAAFDRDFVAVLLARSLHRLQEEAIASGRRELFAHLKQFLGEPPSGDDYERLASVLDMRRNTIAVAVHRLRSRMREITLEELRETVTSEEAFDAELQALKHSLG